jgi:hypothetical protein
MSVCSDERIWVLGVEDGVGRGVVVGSLDRMMDAGVMVGIVDGEYVVKDEKSGEVIGKEVSCVIVWEEEFGLKEERYWELRREWKIEKKCECRWCERWF